MQPGTLPSGTALPATLPIESIKAGQRATWISGDFGKIAEGIAVPAEEFIHRLNLPDGTRVLDVATGTGNLALPLARSGCVVTGVDIAPNLLEQARRRAAAEHLAIAFDEGDAEALPYPDASFDAVVTMFGAMFAPRPEIVAAEFARVLKPGGLLAMANWTPQSFTGQMLRAGAKHVPPPIGLPSPVLWGEEATARQRLETAFQAIRAERLPIDFDFPFDPAGTVAFFQTYYGPTHMAFARLTPPAQALLCQDLVDLWTRANTAADPHTHTLVPNEYLKVVGVRR